jgi:hypothetical protein
MQLPIDLVTESGVCPQSKTDPKAKRTVSVHYASNHCTFLDKIAHFRKVTDGKDAAIPI